ncbi:MAG: anhydro-N-acetylmuramic acid kinase [Cyclobacteriaceae bacterium]
MMSGTSLDGLDIAAVDFMFLRGRWSYVLRKAVTIRYDKQWKDQLATAHQLSGAALIALHTAYGRFLGEQVGAFVKSNRLGAPDFVASHGHTIFHQPDQRFTFQLGESNALHAVCGYPVIADFRSLDVALGGEGAPLVPAGDEVLFGDYDICLNLGGIANLSRRSGGRRIAFDICFCNMALNTLMAEVSKDYDAQGALAATGKIHEGLHQALTQQQMKWRKDRPSLGREMFETSIQPLLEQRAIPLADRLRTVCESVATEIAQSVGRHSRPVRMLATGGGALNTFLMSRIAAAGGPRLQVVIPERAVVEFKEALVFAFLGVLRLRDEPNALRSVTGARKDSSGGLIAG